MSEHDLNTYKVVPAPACLVIRYTVYDRENGVLVRPEKEVESVIAIGYPSFPAADYVFNCLPMAVFLTSTGWICHGKSDEGRRYVTVESVRTELDPRWW
jgi:hypothetical protein